jgi:DNA-binding NarL/FixJ family response regulator
MRIAVCATTLLLRTGLEEVLAATAGVSEVTTSSTMGELVERCGQDKPDAAVLEVDATGTSTRRAAEDLRTTLPAIRLIGLWTARQGEPDHGELLAAGLDEVCSIRHGVARLLRQLRLEDTCPDEEGDRFSQADSDSAPTLEPPRGSTLTQREVDVLAHVSAGLTAAQIGDRLGVTQKTVQNHKQRIYSKLEVQNQTRAVSVAFRRGILDHARASLSPSVRNLSSS